MSRATTLFFITLLMLYLLPVSAAHAQIFKVLHYAETSGFDHQTREESLQMLQSLGALHNFTVDNDADGSAFNTLANLQQYAVVVFANTSGAVLLDSVERANFEAYMNGGGSFLGIHAASDTYRHSTANGANTGAWDWYAEMLGASVQENPNHVAGTPEYSMHKTVAHVTTTYLPDPWLKHEEYYYWENGYYNSANISVLEVEQTTGPNGQVNSYDAVRPIAWYKELPGGGKSFYTALGHAASNFESDTNFIIHIRDAVLWLADIINAVPDVTAYTSFIIETPARDILRIHFTQTSGNASVSVYNLSGKLICDEKALLNGEPYNIHLPPGSGMYFVKVQQGER